MDNLAKDPFREFARVASLPRDMDAEDCSVCGREAGKVCNLDRHALLELGHAEYVRLFGDSGVGW